MPLFSTIIPVHNRATLIGATIQSALAQQADGIENQIIVVDDGSTDGSAQAVRSQFGTAVTVVERPNGGPAAARNTGIKLATGDYVAFLDSDDLWFPWTLQLYRDVLERFDRPSLVITTPHLFSTDAELAGAASGPLVADQYADYFSARDLGIFTGTSAFVVRREALQSLGGFYESKSGPWHLFEDIDLCLRLGVHPNFVHVKQPASFAYRQHEGSNWAILERTFAGALFAARQESSGVYPGGENRRRERLEILTRHLRPVVVSCLRQGQLAKAAELYKMIFKWNLQLHRWKFLAGAPAEAAWVGAAGLFKPASKA